MSTTLSLYINFAHLDTIRGMYISPIFLSKLYSVCVCRFVKKVVTAEHTTGGPSDVILHALSFVVVPAGGISSLIKF